MGIKRIRIAFSCWLLAIGFSLSGQNLLENIIHKDSLDVKYEDIFKHPDKYHLQIIYTQVHHDKNHHITLKKVYLEPPNNIYFYPASLVKLPLSALALEKINNLKIKKLNKYTRLYIDSNHACQASENSDTTSESGYPCIAQYIKRMLLVSDNDAYSRIYEFLTPAHINKRLHEMGYPRVTINQRFKSECDSNNNRYTNGFVFLGDNMVEIYKQKPARFKENIKNHAENTTLGKGYKKEDEILPPKNFRRNNYIPLEDVNNILLSIIYPKAVITQRRFNLSLDDYAFLKKYMGMLPRESTHPTYNTSEYPDSYKKYNYFGTMGRIDDTTIRSYNIVGQAYGFLADCSYIKDSKTGTEFFLSILLYVNKDDILNTGNYQYSSMGLPFMSDVGHAIYNHELKRKKRKT